MKNKKRISVLGREVVSAILIQELLEGSNFLPITDSSVSNTSLRLMLNDIVTNERKSIVEFGSGISTIVFARLFKKNGIKGNIISIDEDKNWVGILQKILERESLEEYVKFIYAPLKKNKRTKSLNQLKWYDEDILKDKIKEFSFDLVFVDGPCAYKKNIMLSRYPALPFIYRKLKSRFSIFLDDVNRKGEQRILNLWSKEYKIKFIKFDKHLGFGSKGNIYNISF